MVYKVESDSKETISIQTTTSKANKGGVSFNENGDGIALTKIKRNSYEYKDSETAEQFVVKGNQLVGITINMFGNDVVVARKLTKYEIVMSLIVFIPCILFGAVGGAFGGGLGFTNLIIIRNIDKWWPKLIISLQFAIIALLMSYVFAYLILKTFLII